MSIIETYFKAGRVIVLRQIAPCQGGGCTVYPITDPLNNVDFIDTNEAFKFLDSISEDYDLRRSKTVMYANIVKGI